MMLPAGIYEVKFGPASWKGIKVRRGETTTIEPGILKVEVTNPSVHINAKVVDSEMGEKHGGFTPVSTSVTLMPGVYDLRSAKTEWRFIKVDGGKTSSLRPAAVILPGGLKWKKARASRRRMASKSSGSTRSPRGWRCHRAIMSCCGIWKGEKMFARGVAMSTHRISLRAGLLSSAHSREEVHPRKRRFD